MRRQRTVPLLDANDGPWTLPPPETALSVPNGLLAAGGALTPDWLMAAYRRGIFPWFSPGDPILWWSPDPRAIFEPAHFVPSKSLRQSIRNRGYESRRNTAFGEVMRGCAAPRDDDGGTWIVPEMMAAYDALHRLGIAQSFETWHDGVLVGGLYGVRVGTVFFGESMFTRARDASKVALTDLMAYCTDEGIVLVDCQMPTPHLASLGAQTVPRDRFLDRLTHLFAAETDPNLRG